MGLIPTPIIAIALLIIGIFGAAVGIRGLCVVRKKRKEGLTQTASYTATFTATLVLSVILFVLSIVLLLLSR